jgi:hypothetical protein
VRTPYQGRYFYIRAWTAPGTKSCELRGAGCAVRLHLVVERGGGESTRDFQIVCVASHPGTHFLPGRLPGLHHIVERSHRNSTSRRGLFQLPNPLLQELWAGSPLTIFACTIPTEGAPSLRFCKGGRRCCRRNFCPFCTNPVTYAFVVPALRQEREGRGTPLCWYCPQDQKPGPPAASWTASEVGERART